MQQATAQTFPSEAFRVVDIAPAAAFLYENHARYKVLHGGRGSIKSRSAARTLLLLAAERKTHVLCAREFQASIADSVHRLLADQIEELGFSRLFDVQKTQIVGANGSLFTFAGLHHNVNSIKSAEGVDICWVEEAEAVSEHSWQVLIPTIRKPGSEIWVTFNPADATDPTYKRFVLAPPPGAIVRKVTWRDNLWLSAELKAELEHMRATDPEAYACVWEGETWARSDAQIFNGKWSVREFEPQGSWDGPYFGADWGFSQDPTVLVRCWLADGCLWVDYDPSRVGCEMDELPALFDEVPGSRQHTIRADSARPETISHMCGRGFECIAVEKGPGSIEDGITFLRSFREIVIHPRCRNVQREARLYRYKVDRLTEDVLRVPVDKHNHCWDALRYALEPMIQNYGSCAISGLAS